MAWNDPPKIDYDQLNSSGRKFKHRYVSPNLGQTNNMLYQPHLTQQNDQFNHFSNSSQQPHTNNVSMNSASNVTYPNHHMYQQQQQQQQSHQQTQQMQAQSVPISYNQVQYQNHGYPPQQPQPAYYPTPNETQPPQQS